MAVYRTTTSWRDYRGMTARVSYYVTAADHADAILPALNVYNAIDGMVRANLQSVHGPGEIPPSRPIRGTTGLYMSVLDKASMAFCDDAGNISRFLIPAPLSTDFHSDGETVNDADAQVAVFIAAMLSGSICSRNGAPFTEYLGGLHRRVKLTSIRGTFIYAPNLTIPAL